MFQRALKKLDNEQERRYPSFILLGQRKGFFAFHYFLLLKSNLSFYYKKKDEPTPVFPGQDGFQLSRASRLNDLLLWATGLAISYK